MRRRLFFLHFNSSFRPTWTEEVKRLSPDDGNWSELLTAYGEAAKRLWDKMENFGCAALPNRRLGGRGCDEIIGGRI